MTLDASGRLMPRLVTFAVWLLLAVSAAYWVLGTGKITGPTALPVAAAPAQADSGAVARLLGLRGAPLKAAQVAAPAPSTNFLLAGVIARGGVQGAALISVDGKPARPYRVGSEVEPGLVLLSVGARSATLAPAGDAQGAKDASGEPIKLELPELKKGGLSFDQPS